jgi:hypothetical protein
MSSIKCPYCPRTFSSKSGYTQHVNHCLPPPDDSDDDELNLVTDVSNMSLDSKEFIRNIEEVKKNQLNKTALLDNLTLILIYLGRYRSEHDNL